MLKLDTPTSFLLTLLLALGSASCGGEAPAAAEDATDMKRTYAYKTVDGDEILADVYLRGAAVGEPRPVVLWIHGGGLIFGTRQWLPDAQLERYLDAGYAVVAVDHRLVPETKLPDILEDIQDAYDWIRGEGPALFGADENNIAVVGHSSGGYLALTSGYLLSPRPKAIVSLYGFADLTGAWTTEPNPHFAGEGPISEADALATVGEPNISSGGLEYDHQGRPKFFRYTKQQGNWTTLATGRDPEEDAAWFSAYEPIQHVDANYPPTMLLHGETDTDVPYEQSVRFAELLASKGVEQRSIIHPDWGHLFDLNQPEDPEVQAAMDDIAAFLAAQFD